MKEYELGARAIDSYLEKYTRLFFQNTGLPDENGLRGYVVRGYTIANNEKLWFATEISAVEWKYSKDKQKLIEWVVSHITNDIAQWYAKMSEK